MPQNDIKIIFAFTEIKKNKTKKRSNLRGGQLSSFPHNRMRRLSSQGTQPGRHNDCRGKLSQTYEYAKKAWLKSLSRFTETGRAPEKADVLTQERLPIYIQCQQLDGKRRIRSLNGDSYRYRGDQTCCSALYWIPTRLARRVLAVTHKKKWKRILKASRRAPEWRADYIFFSSWPAQPVIQTQL